VQTNQKDRTDRDARTEGARPLEKTKQRKKIGGEESVESV
jgi:hypothetical protein